MVAESTARVTSGGPEGRHPSSVFTMADLGVDDGLISALGRVPRSPKAHRGTPGQAALPRRRDSDRRPSYRLDQHKKRSAREKTNA